MATASQRFDADMAVVMKRLNDRVEAIQGRTIGGLRAAGLKVQRLSQKRVPVEYGKLKASAYTRRAMENALAVEVGYSASYAVYVHENIEMKFAGKPRPAKGYHGRKKKNEIGGLGVYWGPAGQPKYLQSAVVELQDDIVKTVADFARRAQGAA